MHEITNIIFLGKQLKCNMNTQVFIDGVIALFPPFNHNARLHKVDFFQKVTIVIFDNRYMVFLLGQREERGAIYPYNNLVDLLPFHSYKHVFLILVIIGVG